MLPASEPSERGGAGSLHREGTGVQEWSEAFHTYIAEPLTRAAPVETLGFFASAFTVTVPAAVLSWLELKETEKSKTGESQRHLQHTHISCDS